MPNRSSFQNAVVLEWLKENGLLAVTVTGVLLYFLFSVPATVFYARLGTSPGEVGITYVSLLSGSTFEILAILILLGSALLLTAFIITYFDSLIRSIVFLLLPSFISLRFRLLRASIRHSLGLLRAPIRDPFDLLRALIRDPFDLLRAPIREPWLLTDQEFDDLMKLRHHASRIASDTTALLRKMNPQAPKSFAEEETLERRRRELQWLGVRTAEESVELDLIQSKLRPPKASVRNFVYRLSLPGIVTILWIRRHGGRLAILLAVITVIIILPALAFVQAGEVIGGKTYVGNNTGVFDYRADVVNVDSISQKAMQSVQALKAQKLFLLGQNAQDSILYSPTCRSTIRVPIATVIITSSR